MNETFQKKLEELDKLNLPKNDYAVTGSGPLAIRNLRAADDIDVVVRRDLWELLIKKYPPYDEHHVRVGNVDIWGDFFHLTHRMDEIIDNSELIEGYRFVTLEDTLSWKKFLNREKDQKDIALIKTHLQKESVTAS
ncbi:MAG: hypothetical protein KR126chlam2_00653 [Chlamydiae bacterium]|nr:hypothetical protein [Chlamydiota bacterium]